MKYFRRSPRPDPSKERVSFFDRLRSKRSHSRHGEDRAESSSTPVSSAVSQEVGDERRALPRDDSDEDVTLEETAVDELAAVDSDSAPKPLIIVAVCTRPSSPQQGQETGLWSAAYREAVESQDAVDQTILKFEKIQDLFVQLEATESGRPDDSLFRKGLKLLEKIKGPLKQMKLVLDVTSPLASAEPAVATVIGVVQGVTALAISLATARETLTANIGEMLDQIQIIDECDTVGQQMDPRSKDHRSAIHKALVKVYSTMLEFYSVAYTLLNMRTGKLTFKLVQDDTQLPGIISRFIELTRQLKNYIDIATSEMVEEIHTNMISNNGFDRILDRDRFHTTTEEIRSDVACEWLLEDETFRKWYSEPGSAQLVLAGEMGCGKTVMVTYVTKRILLRSDHQVPRSLVCYHYCRDDESGNGLCIAQSLVLQLLHQHAKPLQKNFYDWYNAICAQNKPAPTTDIVALLEYFLDRVREIGRDREVVVILDGLDECDTKMASFVDGFKGLSNEVPHLKVLYSTRPHTRILNMLSHVPQLSISSKLNQSRDEALARHLVKKLEPKLGEEEEGKELMSLLVEHLAHSAKGSAIWIRVMIDLVNDQDIVDINDMKDFLQDTPQPQELNEVYVKLFKHRVKGNPKLIATASRALEILAVSRRPLSIRELAYAVALTGCEENPVRLHDIEAILAPNRIKQLIEPFVTQYDPKEEALPQIKLLHRSLQEFILRYQPSEWTTAPLPTSVQHEAPDVTQKRRATMEVQLFQACASYLLLDEINDHSFLSQNEVGFSSLTSGDDLFADEIIDVWEEPDEIARFDPVALGMGPFFVYAACYWLDHFGKLIEPSQEIVEQVIRLGKPGSVRLRNWADQHCRPECTVSPKWWFAPEELDPLSLAALYGSEDMFRTMLTRAERFEGPEFQPRTVFRTAQMILVRGDLARLRMLFLDDRTGPSLRVFDFFRAVINSWRRSDKTETPVRRWRDIFDLVRYATGDMVGHTTSQFKDPYMVREDWANELLCESARSGCLPMLQRLFDEASNNAALRSRLLVDSKRDYQYKDNNLFWQFHQSVGEAVLSNSIAAVRYLLDQPGIGSHFRHRNHRDYTVFHTVARACDPDILALLLSRLPSLCDDAGAVLLINQANSSEDTALNQIIFSPRKTPGRLRCIELLLASGADPNIPWDDIWNRPDPGRRSGRPRPDPAAGPIRRRRPGPRNHIGSRSSRGRRS
ncbi:NACHT domain [Apiospora phragmitis]|uniref:NACHT domain n=1 Tax=Apiospora phragmitis TaxID=2905665 RepID=A0ABR1VFP9_9PEZI